MHKALLLKFLKFSTVGALGMGIDFGVTVLCKECLKQNKYLSNSIGFSAAVCFNYLLNRTWTFESRNNHVGTEFSMFVAVSLAGLLINSLILWLTHRRFGIRFYSAKLIAVGVTVLWNFFINCFITFSSIAQF